MNYFIIKKINTQFNKLQQKKNLKIRKFPIKINFTGEWFYNNSLIKKKALIKLFSSALVCDNKRNFFLETPVEKGSIEVEDSPFVVKLFNVVGKDKRQKIIFKTNLDQEIVLSKKNPLFFKKKNQSYIPYIIVEKNLEARILRSVYYQLVNIALKKKIKPCSIFSQGKYFNLK